MKKLCLALLTFGIFVCAAGCSPKLEAETISFSDYYQGADSFDKIEPALNLYFSCIRSAYDHSDKVNLQSFELGDEYIDAKNDLNTFSQSNGDLSDILGNDDALEKTIAKLVLLEPYLKIEIKLEERNLLLEEDEDAKSEQWFDSLNSLVLDSIDEYQTGGR